MIAATVRLQSRSPLAPLEGQHPQPPVEAGGYSYQLHLPTGYASETASRWPLMIFLHGSGERGSDLDQVKVHGPPKIADRDPAFPFVARLAPASRRTGLGPRQAAPRCSTIVLKTLRDRSGIGSTSPD